MWGTIGRSTIAATVANRPRRDTGDAPREIAATATGMATALIGGTLALFGLGGGLLVQMMKPPSLSSGRNEHIVEGIVDASAALVAFEIISR